MKKFLVLYHASTPAMKQMAKATPEQAKAGMDAWMAWAKKAGKAVVDLGMPLGSGKKRGARGSADATVVGYSVMQSDSMKSVTELFNEHPHLKMRGASIEVFEGLPLPGM
jgi:hypothetical protein